MFLLQAIYELVHIRLQLSHTKNLNDLSVWHGWLDKSSVSHNNSIYIYIYMCVCVFIYMSHKEEFPNRPLEIVNMSDDLAMGSEWINNIIHRHIVAFIIDNCEVSDKHLIANKFNDFFVNIGSSLAEKIPPGQCDPITYVKNGNINTIFLRPVNNDEVMSILKDMRTSSPGWDDLSPKIVKQTYMYFFQPLCHICNVSLLHGIFPNELKIAKVIPLYKGGESKWLVNYRPVSVLPVFSKVLERLMYNRIIEFIDAHDILYDLQFGFRKHHSTSVALALLYDRITQALYDGNDVLGVFLDFSKAFDTVNHDILLRKLYVLGIRGTAHGWIKSYLSNREQFVVFNNTQSTKKMINCGVPQGSILGPLLFLLYINDMAAVSHVLFPILFADDTNVFLNGSNVDDMIRTMNNELMKINEWLYCNKLSLNVSKTHFIIFKSQGMRNPIVNESLVIRNEVIKRDRKTKFLGVMIDEKLSWTEHINYIKSKIAKGIGIICKARKLLNIKTLCTLYYCFVYPYLNYCNEIWGGSPKTHLSPLVKLQNRVIRLISFSGWNVDCDSLYENYEVLQLYKVYVYKIANVMFQVKHKIAPKVLHDMFVLNRECHNYETRQSDHFHVPQAKRNYLQRSITYKGVQVWNYVCKYVDYDCSILSFKKALRRFLITTDIPREISPA